MKRRLLSIVLVVAMIMSMAPVTALAADPVAKINETSYSTLAEAITAANSMTGTVTIEIYGKAEYTADTADLTGAYDVINFVGKTDDAEISITRNGSDGYISGSNQGNDCDVTFTDLILSKPAGSYANDAGFMNVYFTVYRVGDVTYTNCIFPDGACAQGGKVTYTDCEFANKTSGEYSLWVYANCDVTVNGGSFTGVRGAKMYGEGAAKTGNLTLNGVEFTESVTEKPAIVLTYGESVTLSDNTYNNVYKETGTATTFELDLDGDPNGTPVSSDDDITCYNDDGPCGVLVDGEIYTTVTDAVNDNAVTSDSVVTLMYDTVESVELPSGVTLNKNGYTANNVTVLLSYVALGDSMTNGYGMPGYYPSDDGDPATWQTADELDEQNQYGYLQEAPGAWPTLVANEMGWDLTNLSISGMRPEELHAILDPAYEGDLYTKHVFLPDDSDPAHDGSEQRLCRAAGCHWQNDTGYSCGYDTVRADYLKYISEADVISIHLGTNNFGTIVTNRLIQMMGLGDGWGIYDNVTLGDQIEDPEYKAIYESIKADIVLNMTSVLGADASNVIVSIADVMAYGVAGFFEHYAASYEIIRELNPDATIIVVGVSNPLEGTSITVDAATTIDASGAFEIVTDAINIFLAAQLGDDVYFADVEALDIMVDAMGRDEMNPVFAAKLVDNINNMFMSNSLDANTQKTLIQYICSDEITRSQMFTYDSSGKLSSFAAMYADIVTAAADKNMSLDTFLGMFTGGGMAIDPSALDAPATQDILQVYARCMLAEGIGIHPSELGHEQIADAVVAAVETGYTGGDMASDSLTAAIKEAYAYAYDYAVEAGYIDTAVATLEDIKTTLAGLTLDEATPEFQAELAAAVADAINTINELQKLLLGADELDDATLQKALELVAALEKTLAHIDDLLVTAGEDTVDGLLNKWETEWKHALVDTIETIAKEAAEYLKEMLGEAYDAAVEFLSDLLVEYGPKAVQAAYDFLYNNPDKVVAFIKEYYDDAGAFLAKYHEEILMLIGFVASEYGDEIVDYVKNNYEDIIATMLCLLEEYGDEAGALLQVYADYLGWCQPVQDALDDLEAAAKGMKEDLLAALEALKAELEKLYAELEAAEEDIKAEIEEAIKAVEAAIEAIENAIEAVEGLIEAIEDLIAAVESGVHETIVEALENLKAALDAVNEAIAVLEEAVAIAKEVIDVVIVAVEVVAEAVEALTEVVEAIPAIIEEAKAIAAEIDAAINDMFAKIQQAIADIQAALYSACYAVISKCEVGEELVYVALGGATVANGGYVNAVDEYVGADRTINAGQAEGVAYADQLDYVLGHAADIANADLITYQMDANEMVKTLVDAIWSVNVANDYTSPDWSSFIDTEEVVATVEEVKAKVLEVKAELADYLDEETLAWIAEAEAEILAELDAYIDEEAIEEVRPYVESVAYSMVSYSVGVAEAAEAINTINPDAVVLLLGMYNTLEGTSVIMNGEEVDLGEFFTYVVEAVDIYDLVYAVISGNATVVEICEAPVEGVGSLDIDNVMSTMENAAAALAWMEAVENNYAVDHSYIAGQIESVLTVVEHTEVVDAAIEATCTEPGLTEGSHCSVCGKVFVAQEVIPATGHVAGEAVKENEVAAGCTTDGSYDTVVYCSVCGEELSRETTTVPATGHIDENGDGKCDNCGEDLGGSTPDIPSVPSTPVVDDKCDGGADCPSRAFSDLAAALDVEPTVWWHEATDYVIENGLMNGMGDGLFEPNTTTTRAMIVTTLYRIEGAPAVDAESAYTDVAEGMWYTDAIIWATENGIVKGYGDDTFGPMDNVTREQIATIFHRYAEYKGMATSEKADLAEYTDAAEVSGWALEAMQWANECGLMIGRTETTLVPAGETTRAEMAMLLFRWCEEIAK